MQFILPFVKTLHYDKNPIIASASGEHLEVSKFVSEKYEDNDGGGSDFDKDADDDDAVGQNVNPVVAVYQDNVENDDEDDTDTATSGEPLDVAENVDVILPDPLVTNGKISEVKRDSRVDSGRKFKKSQTNIEKTCSGDPSSVNRNSDFNETLRKRTNQFESPETDPAIFEDLNEKKTNEETGNSRRLFMLSLLPDINQMTGPQFRVFRKSVLHAVDNAMLYREESLSFPSTSSNTVFLPVSYSQSYLKEEDESIDNSIIS